MARRYMIDSVLYWAQEYHIDGFRFDLMGLYDVETMNLLRAELDQAPRRAEYPDVRVSRGRAAEAPSAGTKANKNNLAMLNERIGIFCDDTRDAIKGGCFNAREPGYVEGRPGSPWDIGGAVAAWCRSDHSPPHSPRADRELCSAHDNFTLWDKLLMVRYERPEFRAVDKAALAQNRLAAGIYLTSMGLPFWQAGEEFARTKKGAGQQLPLLPALNRLDWQRAQQFHEPGGLLPGPHRAAAGIFPRLGAVDTASPSGHPIFSRWSSRWWAGSCPQPLAMARVAGALRLL